MCAELTLGPLLAQTAGQHRPGATHYGQDSSAVSLTLPSTPYPRGALSARTGTCPSGSWWGRYLSLVGHNSTGNPDTQFIPRVQLPSHQHQSPVPPPPCEQPRAWVLNRCVSPLWFHTSANLHPAWNPRVRGYPCRREGCRRPSPLWNTHSSALTPSSQEPTRGHCLPTPGPLQITSGRASIQTWGYVAAELDLNLRRGRGQWERQSRLREP